MSTTPTYEWHDQRTHWMGGDLPPEVQVDPGSAHLIAIWAVPLTYDGQPVSVTGTLTWYPPPSSLPSTVLGVGLIGARTGRCWAGAVAAAAALPAVVAALLTGASWRAARAGRGTVVYTAGIAAWRILPGLSDWGRCGTRSCRRRGRPGSPGWPSPCPSASAAA